MGNVFIGIFFIIGGLSGEFVLRGTNSSALLVVVGIGLVIWGIYKLNTGDVVTSSENANDFTGFEQPPARKEIGKVALLSSLDNQQDMVGSIVYHPQDQSYIGELASISKTGGNCFIIDAAGKKRNMKPNEIMVMIKEGATA